ncbi:hypothetical protein HanPI659440_Chr16g0625541 [Helianthus annuus]|nr:hypothetical protein HanPI659440_Chr16g0625541 [Helianthus annuus]
MSCHAPGQSLRYPASYPWPPSTPPFIPSGKKHVRIILLPCVHRLAPLQPQNHLHCRILLV